MGRLLRLIIATVAFPLVLLAMLVLSAAGYAFRRRDDDEELLALAEEAAIEAPHEAEGDHDDRLRRWLWDMKATQRLDAVMAAYENQAADVVPDEPKMVWARRRHPEYYAARN